MKTSSRNSVWVAWVIVLLFLLGWQAAVQIWSIPVYLLPAPTRILATLFANLSDFSQATLFTLGEALAGLIFGMAAGDLAGLPVDPHPRHRRWGHDPGYPGQIHPAGGHRAAADALVGLWRHPQDYHHGPADLLSGAGEHAHRPAAGGAAPDRPVRLLVRFTLGGLHQLTDFLLRCPTFSRLSKSAPRWH